MSLQSVQRKIERLEASLPGKPMPPIRVLHAANEAEAAALQASADGPVIVVIRVPAGEPLFAHNLAQEPTHNGLDWSAVTDEQLNALDLWRCQPADPAVLYSVLHTYDDYMADNLGVNALPVLFGMADDPAGLADLARSFLRGKSGNPHWPQEATHQAAQTIVDALEGVPLDYEAARAIVAENKRLFAAHSARCQAKERERQLTAAGQPPPPAGIRADWLTGASDTAPDDPQFTGPPPPTRPPDYDELTASIDARIAGILKPDD